MTHTGTTTATADIIAVDHLTTAIFATIITTMTIAVTTIAVMSRTVAAATGMDGGRAACSTMASFA
jgi:hypothetical protein